MNARTLNVAILLHFIFTFIYLFIYLFRIRLNAIWFPIAVLSWNLLMDAHPWQWPIMSVCAAVGCIYHIYAYSFLTYRLHHARGKVGALSHERDGKGI